MYPEDLSAEAVATKIGVLPEQLFKALLAQGDRHGVCVAVIPASPENWTSGLLPVPLVIARFISFP